MLLIILKLVHFFALAIGVGGGFATGVVGAMVGPKDPALAGAVQTRIGRVGFGALILLWITGIWMLNTGVQVASLGLTFWAKMACVALMTAISGWMQVMPVAQKQALGPRLGMAMMVLAILAIIFAILTFG